MELCLFDFDFLILQFNYDRAMQDAARLAQWGERDMGCQPEAQTQ
jgi:hypothetical protein